MPPGPTQPIHDALVSLLSLALVAVAIALLVRVLSRSRPGLSLAWPVAAGLGVRVLLSVFFALIGGDADIGGGDEAFFLRQADAIAETPFGSALWTEAAREEIHVATFAFQFLVLDPPQIGFRFIQIGIAMSGIILFATAVYDLAGRRAALIACWLLVLEPATAFYSVAIHKEAGMMLAGGLVAFGGVRIWKSGDMRALLPIALGCLLALTTRAYAGWFLIAAVGLIVFHSGLRHSRRGYMQSLTFIALAAAVAAVAIPFVFGATGEQNLERLQFSQSGNAINPRAELNLDQINVSSPGQVVRNLPTRIRDMLTRPYPWELESLNQQLGLLGTIAVLATIGVLLRELYLGRGRILERAGPLIYIGLMLLVAYSLAAGNAGTLFRYRIHVLALGICVTVVLWELRTRAVASAARERYPTLAVPATSS